MLQERGQTAGDPIAKGLIAGDGEEPEEAMVREVQEETGLNAKKYQLVLHEFLEWNECKRGVKGHDFFVYEITDWEGEIKQDILESKCLKWHSVAGLKDLELEPAWEYLVHKLKII